MLTVAPYVALRGNCRHAIDFYVSKLGAQVIFQQTFGDSPMATSAPADQIMHCTLQLGESTLMLCDDPNPDAYASKSNVSLIVSLDDAARAHAIFAALAEEGSIELPIDKTFWSSAFGMLTDRFGVRWMINCQ